jgi:predicted Zn-dependent peptidase
MNQVKIYPVSNGMMLYYFPDALSTNVSGIGFGAGSIYDPLGKKGLAHAVEHGMCRVSRKYPDPYKTELALRQYLGRPDRGSWMIRTDHTSVFYGHGNLLRRKHMYAVFDIMESFVHSAYRVLDAEGMQNVEIPAVRNEYCLSGTDWAPAVVGELLYRGLYTTNPVHWRIDGEFDQVSAVTPQDAEKFVRRFYVPKNAFMIMIGPDADLVKALAERYFRDWTSPATVPVLDYDHSDDIPKLPGVLSSYTARDIKQYHLGMAWPTEVYDSPDGEAIDVLANILETRAWRVREGNTDPEAGAYRVPVETERTMVHGMMSFWAATLSRDYVGKAEKIVLAEIADLRENLSSNEEFDGAVANLRDGYMDAFLSSPGNLAEMIINAATNGDPELNGVYGFRDRLHRVTRRKVREAANKYLATDAYVRAVVGPGPA